MTLLLLERTNVANSGVGAVCELQEQHWGCVGVGRVAQIPTCTPVALPLSLYSRLEYMRASLRGDTKM